MLRIDFSHRFAMTPAKRLLLNRCCPLSLALCAGAYWRTLEVRGLVRRLTGPFVLVTAPACTNRWFSTPAPGSTRPDHSPYWECGGSLRGMARSCQTCPVVVTPAAHSGRSGVCPVHPDNIRLSSRILRPRSSTGGLDAPCRRLERGIRVQR